MSKPDRILLAACLGLVAFHATPASAAGATAYLSHAGSGSTCSQAAPCATMTTAIGVAGAGGEVICLDKGNYAGVIISSSITISCGNGLWEVPASGASINTPAGSDVIIEGMVCDGLAFTATCVVFSGEGALHLRGVRIGNAISSNSGLSFAPSGPAKLFVSDSYIYNRGSSELAAGITVKTASGVAASVSIERTRIENNWFGIFFDGTSGGTIRGVVKDSVVSGNINNGISVNTNGANVGVTVDNTVVSGNNYGLAVGGTNGLILVRRSTIAANNNGLSVGGGGSLVTYRDNDLNNNTVDGAFSFAIPLQ